MSISWRSKPSGFAAADRLIRGPYFRIVSAPRGVRARMPR
jgi:hypothetical protein